MARLIVVFAIVAGLMTAAFGAASTMTVSGTPTIQVGSVGTQCQTGPLTVTNGFNPIITNDYPLGEVTFINISGVNDAACAGAKMYVEAFDASNNQIGTQGLDYSNEGQNAVITSGKSSYKIYFGNKGDGSLPGALRADLLSKYVIWFSLY